MAADLDLDPTNEYNTGLTFDGASVTVSDAGGNQSVDISALAYDDTQLQNDVAQNTTDIATNVSDITTNAGDITTLQTDVATNTTDITTNATDIATNTADIATNTSDIATNSADIATNASDISTHVAADLDLDPTNEYNTGLTFDGASVTVSDAGGNQSVDISALAYDDTQLQNDVAQNTTDIAANVSDITTNAGDITTLQTDVATNTTDITTNATDIATNTADIATNTSDIATNSSDIATNTTDIATNASDIATHVAADLDLDATNEIQTLSITGNDLTISGSGGNTVTLPVTNLSQNTSTGVITYVNENTSSQTANVVGAEGDNSISVGANGGAYYESPIKAFGKIASSGAITRATTGITVTKLSGNGHYRVNLPAGLVSDANYIIQLTQPGRGGAGNDDPGIAYENQTSTSFEVIIGDNDNGGTDRSRFNSEFMFTILDL